MRRGRKSTRLNYGLVEGSAQGQQPDSDRLRVRRNGGAGFQARFTGFPYGTKQCRLSRCIKTLDAKEHNRRTTRSAECQVGVKVVVEGNAYPVAMIRKLEDLDILGPIQLDFHHM